MKPEYESLTALQRAERRYNDYLESLASNKITGDILPGTSDDTNLRRVTKGERALLLEHWDNHVKKNGSYIPEPGKCYRKTI